MRKRSPNKKKFLTKPSTQLTVNHFFKPKLPIDQKETTKKIIRLHEKNSNTPEDNEKLIDCIERFLEKEEASKKSSTPLRLPSPSILNKENEKETLKTPNPLSRMFEEQKSISDSTFADILIHEHMKTKEEEKQKILDKTENLFQITQVYSTSTIDTIPEEILQKLSEQSLNLPFKMLTISHTLFCKDVEFLLFLSGKWQSLPLSVGDMVEVFGKFNQDLLLTISNETTQNYIIYEPNTILYPTLILDAYKCLRRGVLGLNYIGKNGDTNMALIIGCLAHKVFEIAFKAQNEGKFIDKPFLMELYRQTTKDFAEDLYAIKKTERDLEEVIAKHIEDIANWFKVYLYEKKEWIFNEKTGETLKVLKVYGAEQMIIWNNMGLKGQLDAILYCQIRDKQGQIKYSFIPFELKSGKEYFIHFYQGFFYCLLLSHKFEQNLQLTGFFYYLQQNNIIIKTGNSNEIVDMIIRRNSLAYMIKKYENSQDPEDLNLPPMLEKNMYECKMCPFNAECSSVSLAYESKTTQDIEDLEERFDVYNQLKSTMTVEEKRYLKKWLNLLKMEENYEKGIYFPQNATLSINKQSQKSIINNEEDLLFELESIEKLKEILHSIRSKSVLNEDRIVFSFMKRSDNQETLFNIYEKLSLIDNASLKQPETKIFLKCYIEHKKLYQQNNAFCLKFEARILTQELEQNLEKFSTFLDLLDINPKFLVEKVDKTYYPNLRSNIFDLILDPKYDNLKRLLVFNQPNTFENHTLFQNCSFENILNEYNRFNLNPDQIDTIRKSLLADHFNLVLGMPGTGKTHTLAILIKILWDLGFKVLISSYTHSALDNILGKFLDLFPEAMGSVVRFTRFTYQAKEEWEKIIYDRRNFESSKDVGSFFEGKSLIFVTSLSCGGSLIRNMDFDYCIVEEASQVIEPLIIGPLMKAKKFIMIGDYYQLQPLVKNRDGAENGLKVSLFERLCKNDLSKMSRLRYQYRMNKDIMCLSNTLIYKNALISANEAVNEGKLDIDCSKMNPLFPQWIKDVIDPEKRVIFINIDNLMEESLKKTKEKANLENGKKIRYGKSSSEIIEDHEKIAASLEKEMVVALVKALLQSGLQNNQLVVLAIYNLIKNKLEKKLKHLKVDVMTVDKSQGLDSDCIIISCSKRGGKEHLMNNWRRVNVAFTRAKKKLIFVGSINQLSQFEKLKDFIALISAKNWFLNIEKSQYQALELIKTPKK